MADLDADAVAQLLEHAENSLKYSSNPRPEATILASDLRALCLRVQALERENEGLRQRDLRQVPGLPVPPEGR